jgi:predicted dienelactone hydrolase
MSPTEPPAVDAALGTPTSVISIRPVVLPAPGRGEDLQVRVTAPTTGRDLPIVVFSHGFGSSMDGYAPLAEFWAAHGFVVLQPTHLDSRTLGLPPDDPRTPVIWRFRIEDLRRILDQLDLIEGSIPGLAGRLNRDRIAAAGHSCGATTASALLGARILDQEDKAGEDMSDPRVAAGVLLAVAGTGGDDLTHRVLRRRDDRREPRAGRARPTGHRGVSAQRARPGRRRMVAGARRSAGRSSRVGSA